MLRIILFDYVHKIIKYFIFKILEVWTPTINIVATY